MKLIILIFLLCTTFMYSKEYSYSDIMILIENNNFSVKKTEAMSRSMKNMMNAEGFDFMDLKAKYGLMDITISKNAFNTDAITHGISIMQEIPISAKLYFNKKAGEMDYLNSVEEISEKKITIKKMVFDMIAELYLQENMKINMLKEIDLLKKLTEIIKSKYSNAKLDLSYVVETELNLLNSEKKLIEIENMIRMLKTEIIDVLDIEDYDFKYYLDTNNITAFDLNDLDSKKLFASALQFNPSYKMIANEFKKSSFEKKALANTFIPNLEIGFEYKIKPQPMIEHMFGFEIGLNLPLLSLPGKISELNYLKNKIDQSNIEKSEYENNLKNYIEKILLKLKSVKLIIELIKDKSLKISEVGLNVMINTYRVESNDINMLINSIIMNYDLNNDYFENISKYFKLVLELESVTGEKIYNY